MALTKVIGNGLGTLGDGTANDTKIVFDGNAQDYHIGLDDSADTLVIGKGSALGTTTSMSFDENGIITKPLQPAFQASSSTNQNNVAVGSLVTVEMDTEPFDQNADFDTSNYTFTAPVTGKYFLHTAVYLQQIPTGANYVSLRITTSNRTYVEIMDPNFSSNLSYHTLTVTVLADMDASDTAKVQVLQADSTQQIDVVGNGSYTYFCGNLVC